jgi:hypothetical protein
MILFVIHIQTSVLLGSFSKQPSIRIDESRVSDGGARYDACVHPFSNLSCPVLHTRRPCGLMSRVSRCAWQFVLHLQSSAPSNAQLMRTGRYLCLRFPSKPAVTSLRLTLHPMADPNHASQRLISCHVVSRRIVVWCLRCQRHLLSKTRSFCDCWLCWLGADGLVVDAIDRKHRVRRRNPMCRRSFTGSSLSRTGSSLEVLGSPRKFLACLRGPFSRGAWDLYGA